MYSNLKRPAVCAGAACFVAIAILGTSANAQSSTRSAVPMRSGRTVPMQVQQSAPVALQGYCPVCVIEMKKWVKGNPSIQAKYDGKTYYFPSEKQRKMFLADPAKYTPALGGDCVVCLTDMNKRVPGSIHFSALHQNRLFLFPNAELKAKFMANPDKYAASDLALGGKCAVCRVEMNQDVMGKPEFATTYAGMRYLFPSDKQRSMFLANPTKYAITQAAVTGGSGTRAVGSGTRAVGSGTK